MNNNENYKFDFLEEKDIIVHKSWEDIFRLTITSIEKKLLETTDKFTPAPKDIFKIFKLPVENIKVVILGQDPYPQECIATGRAFEVSCYSDWKVKTKNVSLNNIFKELYRQQYGKIVSINKIREEINNESSIIKPDQLFKVWEENGVFLFNTSLTCSIGKPNSHKKIWEDFTKCVLLKISNAKNKKHWLLWGNEAQKYISLIQECNNIIIKTVHPSVNRFVDSGTFKDVTEYCKFITTT